MKRKIGFILFLCLASFMMGYAKEECDLRSHSVLVSVAPHEFFVKKIAGDSVKVNLMVPTAASSHTFEPTPKQMLAASKADVWFQIGEFFEKKATEAFESHNQQMAFVDLRQGLDLSSFSEEGGGCQHCCRHGNCMDLHIWMSPLMAKKQAETIAQALIQTYPENEELYKASLENFLRELDELDRDIRATLKSMSNRTILVSHPAYAYFCREYDLKQMSIEFEGKDPTPQQLTKILQKARQAKVHAVFIQQQYNSKGARLIANELGIKVVMLDPYSSDYFTSMRTIAKKFAE